MKILLVDNNTAHLKQLSQGLSGHDVEIQKYQPGLRFHSQDKDLVILSGGGGEGLEIDDTYKQGRLWYEDEMKFIRSCPLPVIGICMGFEVMAKAYGQDVPSMNKYVSKTERVTTTADGWQLLGKHDFWQIKSHGWHVPTVPKGFKELARSENGVEIMTAPNRLGVQFHPELGGSLKLNKLILAVAK